MASINESPKNSPRACFPFGLGKARPPSEIGAPAPAEDSIDRSQRRTIARPSLTASVTGAFAKPTLYAGEASMRRNSALFLGRDPFVSHLIATNEGPVRLLEAQGRDPHAPAVIFLHGLAGTAGSSAKLAHELLPHCSRAILVDMPNHGKSFSFGEDFSAPAELHGVKQRFVAAVGQALEKHLEQNDIVLLGHSMGGYVAIAHTLTAKQKVKGLALFSPDGAPFADLPALRNELAMKTFGNVYRTAFRVTSNKYSAAFMAMFVYHLFADPNVRYLVHSDLLQPELTHAELKKLGDVMPAENIVLEWGQKEAFNAHSSIKHWRQGLPEGAQILEPDTAHGDIVFAPPVMINPVIQLLNNLSRAAQKQASNTATPAHRANF